MEDMGMPALLLAVAGNDTNLMAWNMQVWTFFLTYT